MEGGGAWLNLERLKGVSHVIKITSYYPGVKFSYVYIQTVPEACCEAYYALRSFQESFGNVTATHSRRDRIPSKSIG